MRSLVRTFRRKIFAKVLLFVCLSTLVILVGAYYILDQIEYDRSTRQLVQSQKFITQSQAIVLPPHLIRRDEERVTLLLSGLLSDPNIIGVVITGTDGKTLYRFGRFRSDEYRLFRSSHPITHFDGTKVRTLGRIVTVTSDRLIVEAQREWRRFFYGTMAVLFIVIVIATYASIHWTVALPLKQLVAAIKRSKDDRPVRVGWSSDDEIGLVIREPAIIATSAAVLVVTTLVLKKNWYDRLETA